MNRKPFKIVTNPLQHIMTFLSSDLRNNKLVDVEHNLVDRFSISIHNFIFLFLFMVSVFLYGDIWLFDGHHLAVMLDALDATSSHKSFLMEKPIVFLHLSCALVVMALSLPLSLYFFFKYGNRISREDFVKKQVINTGISNIFLLMGSVIGFGIFFWGSYLIGIKFPELTHLSEIPFFFLIQVFLILKGFSLGAVSLCLFFQLLFPYSLHPKRT